MTSRQDTLRIIGDMVQGENAGQEILNLLNAEVGIMTSVILAIAILGSLSVFTRSWAAPAIVTVIILPVVVGFISSSIAQMISQGLIAVTVLLIYYTFKRRI